MNLFYYMNLHFHLKNKIIPLMHQNYKNPPQFLHPHGDFISDIIRRTKTFYDLNLLHFLRLNSNISTFLDCGAHIGNHSKFFSDFGSSVFSIEPIKIILHSFKKIYLRPRFLMLD